MYIGVNLNIWIWIHLIAFHYWGDNIWSHALKGIRRVSHIHSDQQPVISGVVVTKASRAEYTLWK